MNTPHQADTFPRLLLQNAAQLGDKTALREKAFGIWQAWTWGEMKDEIFAFAAGLHQLGFTAEAKLAVAGANRPRMYWGMTAAQCLRGIPVPIYPDAASAEMAHVLTHADVEFLLAEAQEQVDKALEIAAQADQAPHLAHIIYDDGRGLERYAARHDDGHADGYGDGKRESTCTPSPIYSSAVGPPWRCIRTC